ncbi:MAG: hypothetical protein WD894_01740 [Pirellulales bacterium]
MLTSVEGIYRDGKIELLEEPPTARESRVIVTFLEKNGPIDLRALGITEEQARDMRNRFQSFIGDWDDPAMDVYNDL